MPDWSPYVSSKRSCSVERFVNSCLLKTSAPESPKIIQALLLKFHRTSSSSSNNNGTMRFTLFQLFNAQNFKSEWKWINHMPAIPFFSSLHTQFKNTWKSVITAAFRTGGFLRGKGEWMPLVFSFEGGMGILFVSTRRHSWSVHTPGYNY